MGRDEVCMSHSGCDARIKQCEQNDADIFKRLRELEITVWKAAGATGVVTALTVAMLQKVIH